MARRGATDLSGILAIDKPAGMTSHDVVAIIRKLTGEKRVGHAGTLDPMATGVLVILIGPATRLAPYLTSAKKSYDARIVFGTQTDTDDAEGHATRTVEVPSVLATEEGAIAHVVDLVGEHMQIPPAFSAIKRDGVVAHRAARAGDPLELQARLIEVTDALLLGVEPGPPVAWNVSLAVSKGTYIRAIARDLGIELGTAAHLGALRRTGSGPIDVHNAIPLSAVEDDASAIRTLFTRASSALDMPVIEIDDDSAARVAVGRTLDPELLSNVSTEHQSARVDNVAVLHDDRLLGIYGSDGPFLRPLTVIPGGVI